MPEFQFLLRPLKYLSGRKLRCRDGGSAYVLSTPSTRHSTGDEHHDIFFEAMPRLTLARAPSLKYGVCKPAVTNRRQVSD